MFTWQDGSTYEGFWVQVGAGVGMGDLLGGGSWVVGAWGMSNAIDWGRGFMVGPECACDCAVYRALLAAARPPAAAHNGPRRTNRTVLLRTAQVRNSYSHAA